MRRFACLLFLSSVLSGCLSSLQTARTVPEDTYRFFAGMGVVTGSSLTSGVSTGTSTPSTTSNFFTNKLLDVGARYGLGTNSDVGFRLNFPAFTLDLPSIYIDGKYELIDRGGFVLSFSIGPTIMIPGAGGTRGVLLGLANGLHFGYDINRYFGLYLVTRVVAPIVLSFGGITIPLGVSALAAAPGIRIGDSWGVLIEPTYLRALNSSGGHTFVVGGAFFIGDAGSTTGSLETNRRAERFKDRLSDRDSRRAERFKDRPFDPRRESMPPQTRPIRGTSRVLKVRSTDNMALISQPTSGDWNIGERVCLFRQNESIACGTITKTDYTGAVLKYGTPTDPITPGMDATSEVNDTRRRPKPSAEEPLEPDPEATSPDIPELP